MTYGRDYGRAGYREPRGRAYDDDRYGSDDRGFLERARDEVASWFQDDEQRRDRYGRDDDWYRGRSYGYDRDYDRGEIPPRFRDEGYRRPYTGRYSTGQSFGDDFGRGRGGYYGYGYQYGRGPREFGTLGARGMHDRDYADWRNRQIDALDRDYEDFRQENSSRFENEFTTWRGQRQGKRKLLHEIEEHMDVLGADKQPIGKVDYVKGDMVVLTKSDSPDGHHHVIPCSRIDRIEKDKLVLDQTAEEVKRHFDQEKGQRALFDRGDIRDEGPTMQYRAFAATY